MGAGGVGIGNGVRLHVAVAEGEARSFRGGNKFAANDAGDAFDTRDLDPQIAGFLREIKLPAKPDERVALFEEKEVSELGFGARVLAAGGVVEGAEHPLATAVRDLVQNGAVAPILHARFQNIEIGRELDESIGVLRRERNIANLLIDGHRRVHGEMGLGDDPFIGSGVPERPAVQNVGPFDNVDLLYRGAGAERGGQKQASGTQEHAIIGSQSERGFGAEIHAGEVVRLPFAECGGADHGGVVCGEARGGEVDRHANAGGGRGAPQSGVAGHASGDDDAFDGMFGGEFG